MRTLMLTNAEGKIVAKLYILENGNLHPDSWLCNEGWPEDRPRGIEEEEDD